MRHSAYHSLLSQLSPEVLARLLPRLQEVSLAPDHVLFEAGQAVQYVYFPVTALIEESLALASGAPVSLRQVDAQAMAGSCVLGDPVASRTARVSQAGQACRMGYDDFVHALDTEPRFRELVLKDSVHAMVA